MTITWKDVAAVAAVFAFLVVLVLAGSTWGPVLLIGAGAAGAAIAS